MNPVLIKAVPERKTDVREDEWIASDWSGRSGLGHEAGSRSLESFPLLTSVDAIVSSETTEHCVFYRGPAVHGQAHSDGPVV